MSESDGPITRYRFSNESSHVVKMVELPDGKKVSTKLPLAEHAPMDGDAASLYDYIYLRMKRRTSQRKHFGTVRVVDLFSGCGGLSLGVMEACMATGKRFLPVAAVDNDPASLAVYQHNFPNSTTIHQDIENLIDGSIGSKPTTSEKQFLAHTGQIDLLLAGPPCQGHSDLNNHTRRNDERNKLYMKVARLAEIARPTHIIIENVPTVIHGKHRAVKKSIDIIVEKGYNTESKILNLVELGVPQKRRRHVVMASLEHPLSLQEVVRKYKTKRERTAWWSISDLANETPRNAFTKASKHSEENIRRMKYLLQHDLYDLPNRLRPPCHKSGSHTYRSMYGRIRKDEPSQTITSGFGSPGQGRYVHPTRPRTLTPHEAARLQFFPDFFDFSAATIRRSLSAMIGNAVPMKLSYVLSMELLS